MTKTQKTVYILVALVALVMGLTFNKIMSGQGQADNTTLIDAGSSCCRRVANCRT